MKLRARKDIGDLFIKKDEVYEFFEHEGFETGKDSRRFEIKNWKGVEYGQKLMVDLDFILENFESALFKNIPQYSKNIEKKLRKDHESKLLTGLNILDQYYNDIIVRDGVHGCVECDFYSDKVKECCLNDVCFFRIARVAKTRLEAR
jgi:hypothetical protein